MSSVIFRKKKILKAFCQTRQFLKLFENINVKKYLEYKQKSS